MKSPFRRKVGRAAYYLRNIARDSAPQIIFRSRQNAIVGRTHQYDADYLSWRLNYYNKLSECVQGGPYSSTVGSIPMSKSMYYYDLKEHARYFPRHLKLNHLFGDLRDVPDKPSIVKSRPIAGDNRNSVVMKLVKFRNFYFPTDRRPFTDKRPIAVWRGGQNNPKRLELVRLYHSHPLCDVGHTHGPKNDLSHRQFLRPDEQTEFKYIISIEGNDMATNLKWILASNSLCLQPKPEIETWFMEGRLEAGRHYVELRDDFADLEDKILYYERHPDEAMEIIRNANAHVAQFLDREREQLLSLLVLCKYFVLTGQMAADPAWADLIMSRAEGAFVTRPAAQVSSAPSRWDQGQ